MLEHDIICNINKISNSSISKFIKYCTNYKKGSMKIIKNIKNIIIKYYESIIKIIIFISRKDKNIKKESILNFYNMKNYIVSKPHFSVISNYYIIKEILDKKYNGYIIKKDLCIILINKMENYLINLINDSYNLTLINNKKRIRNKDINIIKNYLYENNEKLYYTKLLDFSNKNPIFI